MAGERSLIYEFVSEAKEHLANTCDDILALEQRTDDSALRLLIDRLFRSMHSVKGGAAFFGCQTIEAVAHAMETILDHARRQKSAPKDAVFDALLSGADRISALLDDVERSNEADVSDIVARLHSFAPEPVDSLARSASKGSFESSLALRANETQALRTDETVPALTLADFADTGPALAERPREHRFLFGLRVDLTRLHQEQGRSPLDIVQQLQRIGAIVNARLALQQQDLEAGLPSGALVYEAIVSTSLPPDQFAHALNLAGSRIDLLEPSPADAGTQVVELTHAARRGPAESEYLGPEQPTVTAPTGDRSNTIRIPVPLVDHLMTLAGELVLVRNQALRSTDSHVPTVRPLVQRLDAITSDLQDAVLRTRMQPVGNLFNKFPRMVRDLAKQLGKQIELEMSGSEVELDKTILEALSDPLTHLVRNCLDHGIEPAEERVQLGKPVQGSVSLSARHLGGQIHLEVRDDGRGIRPESIRRKALEMGLRTSAELARMGDKELTGLILLPGFSTAAAVTDLSGRGVGMDVVKTNLDRLGGVLEVESAVGRGTTFTLRLPLTLAIIPALLVTTGGERYALPRKNLEELVCLQPHQAHLRIEYAYDQEVVRWRDRLLPLVRLEEVLRRPQPFSVATRAEILAKYRVNGESPSGPLFFAVVKVGSERFGLIVDEILNPEEIVVKPMHAAMKRLACFSGATILGDGHVALILSIEGIARHAGVSFDVAKETASAQLSRDPLAEMQSVLLFKCGPKEQFALPLAMLRRIQRVPAQAIEYIGGREFVTVEGASVAVLRLDQMLNVSPCEACDELYLLLPKNVRRSVGILASAIIDTETRMIELNPDIYRADGLMGTAIVRDHMTLFLDIHRLVERLEPSGWTKPVIPPPPAGKKHRVLLVEDTQFFRQVVKGFLEAEGFDVTTANDGREGLTRLNSEGFDLVVSDLEMPVLDGWGFAKAVRQHPKGAELPLMALTSLDNDRDRERAKTAGFDRYEVKLDRERLLVAVAALLRDHAKAIS